MAKSIPWISHVETFVDASRPSSQQVASVDAIAKLLKNDLLPLETLVREMELYLTTSDHVIRARGILLLAEILTCLVSKPLEDATISSLVGFFTSRLTDWQALRGALVGCLALLRRKIDVGMVTGSDAKALAQSFFSDVHAQTLGVQDRKLCFECLQCLLDGYHEAIVAMDENFIYPICEAIDSERDPRCLMLTFHIVETLASLFPDPCGLVASFAGDLFDILSSYYPIDFTHPNDDFDIKRDDLSRALMQAFCSAPYFEPFVVPLLLDKLSSSLPLAKLDSLKYLNNCMLHYGAYRMVKHAKTIWSSLKDVIFHHSSQGPLLSLNSESDGVMESQESQIAKEALICLQTGILQLTVPNRDLFLSLIMDDIETIFVSASSVKSYKGISEESQRQLTALGNIFSVTSKVSSSSCNRLFEKYFYRLMDFLGVTASRSAYACITNSKPFSGRMNFGALYLCIELLASCRDLSVPVQDSSQKLALLQDSWWYLLQKFSCPLVYSLGSNLLVHGTDVVDKNADPEHFYYLVKGLQALATFRTCCSPITEDVYDAILEILMSVITERCEDTFLWNVSLKSLVQIGSFIGKYQDSKKEMSYSRIVIEGIISLLTLDDREMSAAQKLIVISEIGITGLDFMSKIIQGLEEAIFSNFSKACVEGNVKAKEVIVLLLECYSNHVLPWCQTSGIFDEVAVGFAVNIWNQFENSIAFNTDVMGQGLLDATMITMKLAVRGCTEENQSLILQKAYVILSSTNFFLKESVAYSSLELQGLPSVPDIGDLSCKDEFILSLFTSVVIALRPQTPLPNARKTLELFIVFLLEGHISAAYALASMINKWPERSNETKGSIAFTLEEAIGLTVDRSLLPVLYSSPLQECSFMNDECFSHTCPSSLKIRAMAGLAWIGKGLLMRGHEKVKEITIILCKCILSDQNVKVTLLHPNESGKGMWQAIHSLVAKSAADAFHIFLSDSDFCLKKDFNALIRPLYKQRFFSSVIPVLISLIKGSDSSSSRPILYRAFGHVISGTPLAAVVNDAKKIIPSLLDASSVLSLDIQDKDLLYSVLLVLAGILMDENGKEAVIENTHTVISHLIRLISYPTAMLVRETAIQCLVAMSGFPHARIYPMRPQVLKAVSIALDDRKRGVRQEAVKCRQAWASIASRSLHF